MGAKESKILEIPRDKCAHCIGIGTLPCVHCDQKGKYQKLGVHGLLTCDECKGTGRMMCNVCFGEGLKPLPPELQAKWDEAKRKLAKKNAKKNKK